MKQNGEAVEFHEATVWEGLIKRIGQVALVPQPDAASELRGHSQRMRELRDLISRIAEVDTTVLISGETGVGKELVAREIHRLSPRSEGPWVVVNCGAIPCDLFESTVFGHVRGSFTDAHRDRMGKFVRADGGTLFLDEVGELPLSLQSKLLRVLQDHVVEPVGCTQGVRVDVRVVAATNKNLRKRVQDGTFRRDLFYRLNVVPIEVPPLRERRDDIVELFHYYVRHFEELHDKRVDPLSDLTLRRLREYDWPGNVRELIHFAERVVVLHARGRNIELDLLPELLGWTNQEPSLPREGIDLRCAVAAYERALIREALARTGGNKLRAASLLRIARTTLLEKLKRHFDGEAAVGGE